MSKETSTNTIARLDEVAYQDPRTDSPLKLRHCSPMRISGIAKTIAKSNCEAINRLSLQASLGLIDENQLRIEKEKFLQDLWVCEDEGLHRHINFSMDAEMAIKRACDYRSIKRKLIKVANEERINEEARKAQVGGRTMQPYCSDRTLEFRKRQEEVSHKALEGIYIRRKNSDKVTTLAEIAKKQELRKFNHLFHISKNIQFMADDLGFKGYFVTFTAPGNYHPNPTKGKRSYNQDSLRNAHTYLQDRWKLIRARLAKAGVPLSTSTLFGMRFVEVHKDGCAHWHLLIFTTSKNFSIFRELANELFPAHRQWDYKKIDPKIGSATSYLFKYVAKAVDSSKFEDARLEQNEQDNELFELDRASLAHAKRVNAALRAQGIRQYQCFGIGNAITKYRLINKIEECVSSFTSETMRNTLSACRMYNNGKKDKDDRNLVGFKNLVTAYSDEFELIREPYLNRFGEDALRVTGIKFSCGYIYLLPQYVISKNILDLADDEDWLQNLADDEWLDLDLEPNLDIDELDRLEREIFLKALHADNDEDIEIDFFKEREEPNLDINELDRLERETFLETLRAVNDEDIEIDFFKEQESTVTVIYSDPSKAGTSQSIAHCRPKSSELLRIVRHTNMRRYNVRYIDIDWDKPDKRLLSTDEIFALLSNW